MMQINKPHIPVAANTIGGSKSDMKKNSRTNANSQPKSVGTKKRWKQKFTGVNIGMPTDFKHLQHVGHNASTGGHLNTSNVDGSVLNDPVIASLLISVSQHLGVDHRHILADEEQREYFYGLVDAHREEIYPPAASATVASHALPTPASAPTQPGRNQAIPTLPPPSPPPPPFNTRSGTRVRAPLPPVPSSGRTNMCAPPQLSSQTHPLPMPPPPPPPPPTLLSKIGDSMTVYYLFSILKFFTDDSGRAQEF